MIYGVCLRIGYDLDIALGYRLRPFGIMLGFKTAKFGIDLDQKLRKSGRF